MEVYGTGKVIDMQWKPSHPAFELLLGTMLNEVESVYVVGGVVRDHLLGKQDKLTDLDLAVYENAIPLSRRVADQLGWAFYAMDEGHDVGRLIFSDASGEPLVCDVASMRGKGLEGDLESRDFTINAMAFELRRNREITLIDTLGGRRDLKNGLIRRASPTSLAADPIRLLRAVRFAIQLDMEIEAETHKQVERLSDTIRLASPERVRDELCKVFGTRRSAEAIELTSELGLLTSILPEVEGTKGVIQSPPHFLNVYEHTLATMGYMTQIRDWIATDRPRMLSMDDVDEWQALLEPWHDELRRLLAQVVSSGRTRSDWLVWHALLHDIGKPYTRSEETQPNGEVRYRFFDHESVGATMAVDRLTILRFGRQEIALARDVIAAHMRPHHLHASFRTEPIGRRALYRFVRDTGGPADYPYAIDVALLALADALATYPSKPSGWMDFLQHIVQIIAYIFEDQGQLDVRRRPLLDGHTLMDHLEMEPGPNIGRLMSGLYEAQAAGDIKSVEDALALAQILKQELES